MITIASDDRKRTRETKKPYSLFKRGKEKWVRFEIKPVEVRGAFHVAAFFNLTRIKGIYVGIDAHGTKYKGLYLGYQEGNQKGVASTDEIEGEQIKPADWSKKFEPMQWMIRVKVADRPVVY